LFGDFTQYRVRGMLAALQESCDEPIPVLGPADAVHEHDAACALDDGCDHGYGIAPVHEPARGAGEPRLAAALRRRKLGATARAELEIRIAHRLQYSHARWRKCSL